MRVVIGVGANLGDRLGTMRAAMERLRLVARIEQTSRVYETEPVGPPQPRYLNAAILIVWDGEALALLDAILAIERGLGRTRAEKWGPRTIDLDLLWIEGQAVADARLDVPHPHLRARAFALVPLLELVPDAEDPRTGEPYHAPADEALVPFAARL